MKMQTFISNHNVKIDSTMVDENPNMDSDSRMNHYKVTLRGTFNGKRHQLTTYFSMGLGLSHEPEADDVLDCLASDSASIDNARNFEDWASELGYDTNSRKAERTYRICQRQAERLEKFCGSEAYRELLYKVERL
jgi:hypothetical protein